MTVLNDYITDDVKKVLLIQPNFPVPSKSINKHSNIPSGLLKIGAWLRKKGIEILLIRFDEIIPNSFNPDLILVTSLFTYWCSYVKDTVVECKELFKDIPIIVGGIYASLMPEHCINYTGCDDVITGCIPEAEHITPAYDLIDTDFQILHTSRGCIRNCSFCGVSLIEPDFIYKSTIKKEIIKKKLVFYDNNFLANPHINKILDELIDLKQNRIISSCECQSGFDGRLIEQNPYLAQKLKKAGFVNPRIAWDNEVDDEHHIYKQLELLKNAGFISNHISVFMVFNYEIPYEQMEYKRVKCYEWNVKINDCRYRPLNSTFDNYKTVKWEQSEKDYYIHPNWTDNQVRTFKRNVYKTNICTLFKFPFHSYKLQNKRISKEKRKMYSDMDYEEVKQFLPDAFNPAVMYI